MLFFPLNLEFRARAAASAVSKYWIKYIYHDLILACNRETHVDNCEQRVRKSNGRTE